MDISVIVSQTFNKRNREGEDDLSRGGISRCRVWGGGPELLGLRWEVWGLGWGTWDGGPEMGKTFQTMLGKTELSLCFVNWTILALEEVFISMCRSSRTITFHFNCKTQWQMFRLLYVHHISAGCKARLYLGETLLCQRANEKLQKLNSWQGCFLSYPRFLTLGIKSLWVLILIAWIRSNIWLY